MWLTTVFHRRGAEALAIAERLIVGRVFAYFRGLELDEAQPRWTRDHPSENVACAVAVQSCARAHPPSTATGTARMRVWAAQSLPTTQRVCQHSGCVRAKPYGRRTGRRVCVAAASRASAPCQLFVLAAPPHQKTTFATLHNPMNIFNQKSICHLPGKNALCFSENERSRGNFDTFFTINRSK